MSQIIFFCFALYLLLLTQVRWGFSRRLHLNPITTTSRCSETKMPTPTITQPILRYLTSPANHSKTTPS